MNLNHVHLGTKNLEKFESFYRDFFGFDQRDQHGPGVFLRNSAGFLIAVDPVNELPELPSWYHLGFCLDSESEVHELYNKMTESKANIVREMISETGEFASFYVADPDGNKIEISWHNE